MFSKEMEEAFRRLCQRVEAAGGPKVALQLSQIFQYLPPFIYAAYFAYQFLYKRKQPDSVEDDEAGSAQSELRNPVCDLDNEDVGWDISYTVAPLYLDGFDDTNHHGEYLDNVIQDEEPLCVSTDSSDDTYPQKEDPDTAVQDEQ